jgi:hypothetical protein
LGGRARGRSTSDVASYGANRALDCPSGDVPGYAAHAGPDVLAGHVPGRRLHRRSNIPALNVPGGGFHPSDRPRDVNVSARRLQLLDRAVDFDFNVLGERLVLLDAIDDHASVRDADAVSSVRLAVDGDAGACVAQKSRKKCFQVLLSVGDEG